MLYEVMGDDGVALDAHLEIEGDDFILHSRGGIRGDPAARNLDYTRALQLLLERINQAGLKPSGAWVASDRTKLMPLDQTTILDPDQFGEEPSRLVSILSLRMKAVGRPPDAAYGGSPVKKIRVRVGWPPSGGDLAEILGVRAVDGARRQADSSEDAGRGARSERRMSLITDLALIDQAMNEWLAVLDQAARPVTAANRWLAEEAIMFSRRSSTKRQDAWDVELGVSAKGAPWTVQLNAPTGAADANGLTSIATDADGRRVLIRQGRLRPNSESDGEVVGVRFRELSGLAPANVTGGTTPTPRDWYLVADLDASPESIRRETGRFVHACAQARLASLGVAVPSSAPPLLGSDEKGGSFFKKAVDAQPEKEVRRLQGEVWLALRRVLEAGGIKMIKLRHEAGYEVDGVILAKPKPILLEIKTAASAADVYEGVGQLILYGQMLNLKDHERVLLLPARPSATLDAAARACDLRIHHYHAPTGEAAVAFSDDFLVACGLDRPTKP